MGFKCYVFSFGQFSGLIIVPTILLLDFNTYDWWVGQIPVYTTGETLLRLYYFVDIIGLGPRCFFWTISLFILLQSPATRPDPYKNSQWYIPLNAIECHSVSFSTIGPFNGTSVGVCVTVNGNLKHHSVPLNIAEQYKESKISFNFKYHSDMVFE